VSQQRESHKQALRQLLDRWCIIRPDREQLIEEILGVSKRFNYNPGLDEALNSGDGSYKP
jgi:hypothetical protein